MAYILYNLTHLIPRACPRNNFGIQIVDDMRVLGAGKHKILNALSDKTKKYARKRLEHNGVEYEILRIVETKDGEETIIEQWSTTVDGGSRSTMLEFLIKYNCPEKHRSMVALDMAF